jgi:hypothetical protein
MNEIINMKTQEFYNNVSTLIKRRYGFEIDGNITFKMLDKNKLFLSLENNQIFIGFTSSGQYENILNEFLSEHNVNKYFTDFAFDTNNNIITMKYLLKDKDDINEFVFIFECLVGLEIKYRKYVKKTSS